MKELLMKMDMATRNPTDVKIDRSGCTDFMLHKSQQTIFTGIQNRIIDYTEHRLIRYIKTTKDTQQKLQLAALLCEYKLGNVAIAWKRGQPKWLKVVKNG